MRDTSMAKIMRVGIGTVGSVAIHPHGAAQDRHGEQRADHKADKRRQHRNLRPAVIQCEGIGDRENSLCGQKRAGFLGVVLNAAEKALRRCRGIEIADDVPIRGFAFFRRPGRAQ